MHVHLLFHLYVTRQVKDYRRQTSPSQCLDGTFRDGLGCLEENFEGETVEQKAKQDVIRQTSDEQTEFVIPPSRSRTDRVLNDETNLHHACLPRKRTLLASSHTLRSHLPCQVCYSHRSYWYVFLQLILTEQQAAFSR